MNFETQCSAETFGYLEGVIVTAYPRLFDIMSTVWLP